MFGSATRWCRSTYQICAAWEVNNLDRRASAQNTQVDKSRSVTIELDANAHHMAWRFRPLVNHSRCIRRDRHRRIRGGQRRRVALNRQACRATGRSSPASISQDRMLLLHAADAAPARCGACRLVFMIDPRLPKDVNTIVISYTFFQVEGRGGNRDRSPSSPAGREKNGAHRAPPIRQPRAASSTTPCRNRCPGRSWCALALFLLALGGVS